MSKHLTAQATRLFLFALALFNTLSQTAFAAPAKTELKHYSFDEALSRALTRNPTALTAQQDILRAEALVHQARAGSLPYLVGNLVGTRIDHARTITDRVLQGAQSISGNVQLTVPLLVPANWLRWMHAKDAAEVSRASAEDIRRSLSIATARAYLAVIAQHRTLEVNETAFRTAEAHYQYAQKRWVGGVGTRLDEVRADREQATTRVQVALAQSALVKLQEALGVLLGEDCPVDTTTDVPLAGRPPLELALRDAPDYRADIAALRLRAETARRVARDSYADFLPLLSAQLQPFYQNPATLTMPQWGWQAQLILTVPLISGGADWAARRDRQAQAAQARIALEGAVRQVQSDVRAAFEALLKADEALEAAQRSAQLAKETLSLAMQSYRAGATTNLEVIDAERGARDADTAAAVAEDGARQARLDLLAASGRFP